MEFLTLYVIGAAVLLIVGVGARLVAQGQWRVIAFIMAMIGGAVLAGRILAEALMLMSDAIL